MVNIAFTYNNVTFHYKKQFLFYTPNPKQESFHTAGDEAIERLFLAGIMVPKNWTGKIVK